MRSFIFTFSERVEKKLGNLPRTLPNLILHLPRTSTKTLGGGDELFFKKFFLFLKINPNFKEIEFTKQSDSRASCDLATPS